MPGDCIVDFALRVDKCRLGSGRAFGVIENALDSRKPRGTEEAKAKWRAVWHAQVAPLGYKHRVGAGLLNHSA